MEGGVYIGVSAANIVTERRELQVEERISGGRAEVGRVLTPGLAVHPWDEGDTHPSSPQVDQVPAGAGLAGLSLRVIDSRAAVITRGQGILRQRGQLQQPLAAHEVE